MFSRIQNKEAISRAFPSKKLLFVLPLTLMQGGTYCSASEPKETDRLLELEEGRRTPFSYNQYNQPLQSGQPGILVREPKGQVKDTVIEFEHPSEIKVRQSDEKIQVPAHLLTPVSPEIAQKNFTAMVKALKFFYDVQFRTNIRLREESEGRTFEDYQATLLGTAWAGQGALKEYLLQLSKQVNSLIPLITQHQEAMSIQQSRNAKLEKKNLDLDQEVRTLHRTAEDRRIRIEQLEQENARLRASVPQPANDTQPVGLWTWFWNFICGRHA